MVDLFWGFGVLKMSLGRCLICIKRISQNSFLSKIIVNFQKQWVTLRINVGYVYYLHDC